MKNTTASRRKELNDKARMLVAAAIAGESDQKLEARLSDPVGLDRLLDAVLNSPVEHPEASRIDFDDESDLGDRFDGLG